jgi:UDP-N-acetylglucosamine transferase subunit ALG13
VILVTLGTHPQPMDRLVRELERLLGSGALRDDVLIQAARFGDRPVLARAVDVLPYEELLDLVRTADVVITHGGTGNLATIRAQGRVPVVVPRSAAHGEHVDDHQRDYAARLRTQPGYIVVHDIGQLGEAIEQARRMRTEPVAPDVSRAVELLERLAACG